MKGYELKVTLSDIDMPIWFKVNVPQDFSFLNLHETIMECTNWTYNHIFAFVFDNLGVSVQMPDDEDFYIDGASEGTVQDADETELRKLFKKESRCVYQYDFGDGWECEIEVLSVIDKYRHDHAFVVEGEGKWPPEDCGGIGGYEELLRILGDTADKEHNEMHEWIKNVKFDDFDATEINKSLATIYSEE